MKILVTPTSLQPGKNDHMLQYLQKFSTDLVFNPYGRPLAGKELKELLHDCDGYIAGVDKIDAEALSDCPKLKVISRYGVGVDGVDFAVANEKHIKVTNTPGANSEAVGELAFAMILALARNLSYLDTKTREGEWIRSTGVELSGKTLAILGLGAIGKIVARCAKGFNMNVIAYDPYIDMEYCKEHKISPVSLQEAYAQADVISLHLPLLPSTRHLIDAKAFEQMKKGVIVINASRGGIIDETAAYAALKSGKVGGLGLDAFEEEPPKGSALFEFQNVIATPHTGAHTKEATDHMGKMAIDNLIEVLNGKECKYIVNR